MNDIVSIPNRTAANAMGARVNLNGRAYSLVVTTTRVLQDLMWLAVTARAYPGVNAADIVIELRVDETKNGACMPVVGGVVERIRHTQGGKLVDLVPPDAVSSLPVMLGVLRVPTDKEAADVLKRKDA